MVFSFDYDAVTLLGRGERKGWGEGEKEEIEREKRI